AAGSYRLRAAFTAAGEEAQEDARPLLVVPAPAALALAAGTVALWDPTGASAPALRAAGVPFTAVADPAAAATARVLVIGRGALRPDAAVPGIERVAAGLNLLVLEQGEEALRERFGLRTQVRGERNLHLRSPGHPALAGLDPAWFADWRGAATLVPPWRPAPAPGQPYETRLDWNGFANAEVPRNGNRGAVASVLFEKPVRADVLPLVDGAFDLQYAALAAWRQGAGRVVLCQLDVSGRDRAEPVAALVLNRLLAWLAAAPAPETCRPVRAAGAQAAALCARLGVALAAGEGAPAPGDLLVIAPGHGRRDLLPAVAAGARVLAIGCGQDDLAAAFGDALPWAAGPTRAAFRAAWDEPFLAGCSNADLYLRTWLPGGLAVEGGRDTVRVLRHGAGVVVALQAAPWLLADPARPDLRTSERRAWFLCARVLANLGAAVDGGLLERAGDTRLGSLALDQGWRARLDPGEPYRGGDWTSPAWDERAWPAIRVGEAYNGQLPRTEDHLGVVWYRLRTVIPAGFAGDRPTVLRLGPVDDVCAVWLDGVLLGEVTKASNPKDHWSVVKDWPLPAGLLKPGQEQVLTVRVDNTFRTGGIMAVPQLLVQRPSPYVQDLRADDDPYRYFNW
ncbi:MAG: hypothetical protein L6R48_23660, partial [Planctomycetes bacterium]|nr:hypothetical protein [Planctomycetota bacterium]